MSTAVKDFFISYTSTDQQWAEWIAWYLEQAGYSIIIQAWDFPAGSNFVYEMDNALKEAQRVVAVLSPAYMDSEYGFSEWAEAFRRDPQGKERQLLPVRVQPCEVKGLLGPIVYCDLVECDEKLASKRLLAAARGKQDHPTSVAFPGTPSHSVVPHPRFPGSLPPIWNIPYPRNPYFTGRDDLLKRLAEALKANQATALSQAQAISGLGGIGKTQIAVEYAYQHRNEYEAVLWVLADSRESLVSGYITLAELLNLPQKSEQDQGIIIGAVKNWLQSHGSWLLILDNADDLKMASEFIPPTFGGHLLLTTRAQSMGRLAKGIEVDTMDKDTGALFLLRRVGLVEEDASLDTGSSSDVSIAREICKELDGLPLALDQAGAYIEETKCSLKEYLRLYGIYRSELLKLRGGLVEDHREPVATTWSISFKKVEEKNLAAADLLRLCAFLAPDVIPEEMITQSAEHFELPLQQVASDPLLLNSAIAALSAYSLIRRNPSDKTLSIHRLVQAVLRDTMNGEMRKQWTERTVKSVNAVFPKVEFEVWTQCERYLPHALSCAQLIEQEHLTLLEGANLLSRIGSYLQGRGQYSEVELLKVRALSIHEQQLGKGHPDVAASLNNLAELYRVQGKYEQAEPLFQRALSIYEQQLGEMHPRTAVSLNNLASLYYAQGKYEQAEPLYQRSLSIREQQLGADHPDTATSLNNLALLYRQQGKYEQTEPLHQRALSIYEQQLGEMHPDTAMSLNNLAALYYVQGKYEQAELLFQRALTIDEKVSGLEHPDVAGDLHNLAVLYYHQDKYETAEPLFKRALLIRQQTLGTAHPSTQNTRNLYIKLLRKMGRDAEATALESGQLPSEEHERLVLDDQTETNT